MAIMHHIDRKQLWFLLIVGALFFAGTWMRRDKQDQTPTTEMLDAQLLKDLQGRTLQADEHTLCIMECAGITTTDLKDLLVSENLDQDQCDFGNCHYTSYALKGHLKNGKQVSFTVETGDGGDILKDLQLPDDCPC
ncbi:MAG: hypothetical protein H6548_09660 [Chitinophagales bacterium]|nr:hypothetical protein [Chitinophagales bacterium]HAE13804.1 hypothetical protein [Bacteroidota bacterium]MCB9022375.1 hypothetical protein [Chitinophagales bacterium]HAE34973.1 hypothetical protein [Bacteroidota bacterium]HPE97492.1 hypothetical protein [Chitinophagales bacterium]